MNLNQVTVSVTDIERAVIFYAKLGLQLIVQSEHYCRFIVAGNNATFSIHKTEKVQQAGTVIYFETDDVGKAIAALKKKGIKIISEPVMQNWLWYEAYIQDPDGNSICIYHAGENRLNPPWRIKSSF